MAVTLQQGVVIAGSATQAIEQFGRGQVFRIFGQDIEVGSNGFLDKSQLLLQNRGQLEAYKPNTVRGGHAVCLVGYTPDHFIVRNSWGTQWGDKGFAYASNDYAQEAFTEAYGAVL